MKRAALVVLAALSLGADPDGADPPEELIDKVCDFETAEWVAEWKQNLPPAAESIKDQIPPVPGAAEHVDDSFACMAAAGELVAWEVRVRCRGFDKPLRAEDLDALETQVSAAAKGAIDYCQVRAVMAGERSLQVLEWDAVEPKGDQ